MESRGVGAEAGDLVGTRRAVPGEEHVVRKSSSRLPRPISRGQQGPLPDLWHLAPPLAPYWGCEGQSGMGSPFHTCSGSC